MTRAGMHVSIAGGIENAPVRARDLGCQAMQIFSRNPRGWATSSLDPQGVMMFRQATGQADIDPVVIHTPYLINLAAEAEGLYERSAATLALDLGRAGELGARYVVTHLGSSGTRGFGDARKRVVEALNFALAPDSSVVLLLENSAGAGNLVGSSLEELRRILEGLESPERVGVCFDSCHGFAAGYDFRTPGQARALWAEMEETLGKRRVKLLHINDSSAPLGSRVDRHQHIGRGRIGLEGFRSLLGHPGFGALPMILETPRKTLQDDRENLGRIRAILESVGRGKRYRCGKKIHGSGVPD
jgi:deoxyribonuclease IV